MNIPNSHLAPAVLIRLARNGTRTTWNIRCPALSPELLLDQEEEEEEERFQSPRAIRIFPRQLCTPDSRAHLWGDFHSRFTIYYVFSAPKKSTFVPYRIVVYAIITKTVCINTRAKKTSQNIRKKIVLTRNRRLVRPVIRPLLQRLLQLLSTPQVYRQRRHRTSASTQRSSITHRIRHHRRLQRPSPTSLRRRRRGPPKERTIRRRTPRLRLRLSSRLRRPPPCRPRPRPRRCCSRSRRRHNRNRIHIHIHIRRKVNAPRTRVRVVPSRVRRGGVALLLLSVVALLLDTLLGGGCVLVVWWFIGCVGGGWDGGAGGGVVGLLLLLLLGSLGLGRPVLVGVPCVRRGGHRDRSGGYWDGGGCYCSGGGQGHAGPHFDGGVVPESGGACGGQSAVPPWRRL
jgi:hypothetical protein